MASWRRVGSGLALPEQAQRVAQIVLGGGPAERLLVACPLLQCVAISLHGRVEPRRTCLALPECHEGIAEIVLAGGPIERCAVAWPRRQRLPVCRDRVEQGLVQPGLVAVGRERVAEDGEQFGSRGRIPLLGLARSKESADALYELRERIGSVAAVACPDVGLAGCHQQSEHIGQVLPEDGREAEIVGHLVATHGVRRSAVAGRRPINLRAAPRRPVAGRVPRSARRRWTSQAKREHAPGLRARLSRCRRGGRRSCDRTTES